ncbi:amidohydrolase [Paucisalibacillus sp. EB02]|uniref:amidohydrolase n=1 Tax=Paucisalibacillus sp. EB02 TaxID=1347087 RepID=UPI0004B25BB2|nr:amidohydrolase [Paucisalibacillus sp. EB02]
MQRLYYGGDIITMENENDHVQAVLVEDGKIKKVGTLDDVEYLLSKEKIEKINLEGKTLMPAFIDAHGHISMVGPISVLADLSGCESFDHIIYTMKAYMEEKGISKGEMVVGFGYDHNNLLEEKHPTKEVLNQVSTENPIFISHASAHMGIANDAALRLIGIDENTPDPEGGHIGRIEGSNEPNGYLEEGAMMPLQEKVFKQSGMDTAELALVAQDIYIKNGITTIQDGATSLDTINLFKTLSKQKKLKVDVVAYPLVSDDAREIWKNNQDYTTNYSNHFRIGGYKMFLDGSPQGKTAWLTEPYEGEESYLGYPWFKDEQVKEMASMAIHDNVQLLTHCNGDAASDQLLRNYEAALKESNNPNKNKLRPVMIHCQTVRYDQLDKMVELEMIPSIFVSHTYYWGDVHLKNLGDERGNRISPAKSAFDRGLCVNFHQDAPVIKPDMLHTLWCAVNRQTRKGVTIGPEERVSVYDALKALTINAAYQYSEENIKGSIKEGKLADLVILDENPLKVAKMELKDIQVVETIKEGNTIYRASFDSFQTAW